jgi:hypothetical protein
MGRAAVLLVLITGCGTDVVIGRECPQQEPTCQPALQETAPAVAPMQAVPELSVQIAIAGVATGQIALTCESPCAVIEAVAYGGAAPYAFNWEDGSTEPVRLICPTGPARYVVSVAETQASDRAAANAASAASASLDASPPSCPAAAPVTDEANDAAPERPRCEALELQRRPPGWSERGCSRAIRALAARPLEAGKAYDVQAFGPGVWEGSWRVELWGSANGCQLNEKLSQFLVTPAPVDVRLEFVPNHDHAFVVLTAIEEMPSDGWVPYLGYLICDDQTTR